MANRGDDLEDDFVADDLVALSDGGVDSDLNSDYDEDPGAQRGADPQIVSVGAVSEKKRKRKEKLKERKAKRRKLHETDERADDHNSIAAQAPERLSEYLATCQARCFSDHSALELEDARIPENCIVDTTAWTGSRTLDDLVPFIIKVVPSLHTRLSQKSKSNGAPTLLFLTGAALRVADVTRVLKDKRLRGDKGGEVAKLFAKHFKLNEHAAYLKRTKIGAAAGTPGRIGKLLCSTDSLSISALSHIMLDVTFRDAKKRNLLDIPETRDEIFRTVLNGPGVLQAIKSGKVQVVLF